MEWVLKNLHQKHTKYIRRSKDKNLYKANGKGLKYCESCGNVWERDYMNGTTVRYSHLPTYGKTRKTCSICIKESKEKI